MNQAGSATLLTWKLPGDSRRIFIGGDFGEYALGRALGLASAVVSPLRTHADSRRLGCAGWASSVNPQHADRRRRDRPLGLPGNWNELRFRERWVHPWSVGEVEELSGRYRLAGACRIIDSHIAARMVLAVCNRVAR